MTVGSVRISEEDCINYCAIAIHIGILLNQDI
jgi:hypothetical protein